MMYVFLLKVGVQTLTEVYNKMNTRVRDMTALIHTHKFKQTSVSNESQIARAAKNPSWITLITLKYLWDP